MRACVDRGNSSDPMFGPYGLGAQFFVVCNILPHFRGIVLKPHHKAHSFALFLISPVPCFCVVTSRSIVNNSS